MVFCSALLWWTIWAKISISCLWRRLEVEELVFSLHSCKILNLFVVNSQLSWKHVTSLSSLSLDICHFVRASKMPVLSLISILQLGWQSGNWLRKLFLCVVVLTTSSKCGMAN
jgi:hypothetical protein